MIYVCLTMCLYLYVCTCIYIIIFVYIYIYIRSYLSLYIYIHLHIHRYVHMYLHMNMGNLGVEFISSFISAQHGRNVECLMASMADVGECFAPSEIVCVSNPFLNV